MVVSEPTGSDVVITVNGSGLVASSVPAAKSAAVAAPKDAVPLKVSCTAVCAPACSALTAQANSSVGARTSLIALPTERTDVMSQLPDVELELTGCYLRASKLYQRERDICPGEKSIGYVQQELPHCSREHWKLGDRNLQRH